MINLVQTLISQLDHHIWNCPEIFPEPQLDCGSIQAIYFSGPKYRGQERKIFAYIGFPDHINQNNPVPAVVLAHGGGGTAFPEWVKIWNDKGYAAIAMDLEGNHPIFEKKFLSVHHTSGGPSRAGEFLDVNEEIVNQWPYHAISDVIIANSLLRNDRRIDPTKIGLSGISWGGLIASLVIGIDSRFAFAVPVYGCGFLRGQSNYLGSTFSNNPKTMVWEPSNYIPQAKLPILWLNDDIDSHFPAVSTSQSFISSKSGNISLIRSLGHSHEDGWSREEIYAFADSIVSNGIPLPIITRQPGNSDHWLEFSVQTPVKILRAEIIYSFIGDYYCEDGRTCLADWQVKPAVIIDDIVEFDVPVGTHAYYIALYDNRNMIITSCLVEMDNTTQFSPTT